MDAGQPDGELEKLFQGILVRKLVMVLAFLVLCPSSALTLGGSNDWFGS